MSRNLAIPALDEDQKARIRSWLIHHGEGLLVFDKPSGIPVQTRGGKAESLDFLLWAFARSNGKRPRLVHRIDAATSGLLVAATTQPMAAHLSAAFAERRVAKTYLALVRGDLPAADEGVIDAAIRAHSPRPGLDLSQACAPDAPDARPARTGWRVLSRSGRAALIEARPETGRMHQIRVHLAHLGCAILGDPLYGAGALSAPRLMLHATGLCLPMPGGDVRAFHAPLHEDMRQQALQLGLSPQAVATPSASS